MKILFIYAPSLSYIEKESYFSSDIFRQTTLLADEFQGLAENIIYLYDPLDIVIEHGTDSVVFDPASWRSYVDFVLARLDCSACHALSITRLSLFFELNAHIGVLSEQPSSDEVFQKYMPPLASPVFAYLSQLLSREKPFLLDQYLDLESRALLLGTQADSNWYQRVKSEDFSALRLIRKVNSLYSSLKDSLKEAHKDLDAYYSCNQRSAELLNDYNFALEKAIQIILKQ